MAADQAASLAVPPPIVELRSTFSRLIGVLGEHLDFLLPRLQRACLANSDHTGMYSEQKRTYLVYSRGLLPEDLKLGSLYLDPANPLDGEHKRFESLVE